MIEIQIDFWQILAANVAIGIGAFIQSGTGFGLGLVAVPLLALIAPVFVPAPFLMVAFLQVVIMAIQNRKGIVVFQAKNALMGVFVGTVLAFLLLTFLQEQKMGILFGASILFAIAISCSGVKLPIVKSTLWGAGMLCGLMGTISGVGGPPLILIFQNEKGPNVRGNLGVIFTFSSVLSIIALTKSGYLGLPEICLAASLIPGIFLGTITAPPFRRYLDRTNLRPALLGLAATGAIALIVRDLV